MSPRSRRRSPSGIRLLRSPTRHRGARSRSITGRGRSRPDTTAATEYRISAIMRPRACAYCCRRRSCTPRLTAAMHLPRSPGAGVSAGIDAEYTCRASQGAVLVLQSEAHSQTIFENTELKEDVLRHHEGWCAFARDVHHLTVKSSAIVMVSGWVKTGPDWAAAAFSNTGSRRSASVKASAGGLAGGRDRAR
ncbi:hypothetical protein PsYK624_134670 [Phanerochaete sordida]|uniref:Uncharacterized protein n=1 Tax=Phanerochaete sordida TaxID=48140 RepID=A0A9P3GLL2_9APHY|nr:hypothetical protein PsYK624_134670 [Phanerochaete sordida]